MTFSDEQLSAFIDHELPETEMQLIRDAIVEDSSIGEQIAERIAELASADAAIISTYSAIDDVPLPDSIRHLLKAETINQTQADNVLQFPLFKRASQQFFETKNWLAAAAVAALVVGLNTFNIEQHGQNNLQPNFAMIESLLDQAASGEPQNIAQQTLLIRASFSNQQGQYCRQFLWQNEQQSSENIACYKTKNWQIVASIETTRHNNAEQYQSASSQHLLDKEIDQMINGAFYNSQQEQNLIQNNWTTQP